MLHSLEMVLIGGEGNAVHPRAERREPLVAVQSAPHTDEGLLREVIAQRLIATRLYEEVAAHRAQIPLHQSAECTPIVQEQHTGDKEYFFGSGHGVELKIESSSSFVILNIVKNLALGLSQGTLRDPSLTLPLAPTGGELRFRMTPIYYFSSITSASSMGLTLGSRTASAAFF